MDEQNGTTLRVSGLNDVELDASACNCVIFHKHSLIPGMFNCESRPNKAAASIQPRIAKATNSTTPTFGNRSICDREKEREFPLMRAILLEGKD